MPRIILDVMIQTPQNAIVISNASTSKLSPKSSDTGILTSQGEHHLFLIAATVWRLAAHCSNVRSCGLF
jgi:hypothetical protein